jgi:hypothetical protein
MLIDCGGTRVDDDEAMELERKKSVGCESK